MAQYLQTIILVTVFNDLLSFFEQEMLLGLKLLLGDARFLVLGGLKAIYW